MQTGPVYFPEKVTATNSKNFFDSSYNFYDVVNEIFYSTFFSPRLRKSNRSATVSYFHFTGPGTDI